MSQVRLLVGYVSSCMECPCLHDDGDKMWGNKKCDHPRVKDNPGPDRALLLELNQRNWKNGRFIETGSVFPPGCPLQEIDDELSDAFIALNGDADLAEETAE